MNRPAEVVIDLTSDPCELSKAREAIRGWVGEQGWGDLRIADVVLAADEALTNVMRHGYQEQTGKPIQIFLRELRDDQQGRGIEIEIRDWGRQVPLEKICGRDLDDIRPGGLGVHIIRNLMDEAVYAHAEGGGMRLIMRKFHTPGSPA